MVNCNPETVSTDYDTSDKLYFEPLTVEDVLSIYEKEKPEGVIVQFGGQTPLNIARELAEAGVKILGTSPESIDLAEDRDRFRQMMRKLGIPQPESGMASTIDEALAIAARDRLPADGAALVRARRPGDGGGPRRGDAAALPGRGRRGLPERPILIDKFLENAIEVEADAIADGEDAFVPAVMEHIELAGIHSGDSACVIPPISIPPKHIDTIHQYNRKIAIEFHVVGLMNIQYAICQDTVYVLEANPRASRTVPLVSKVCNIPMARIATQVMLGKKLSELGLGRKSIPHFGVKEAVFPFNMYHEVDPVLGPEMRSTGEVLGHGRFLRPGVLQGPGGHAAAAAAEGHGADQRGRPGQAGRGRGGAAVRARWASRSRPPRARRRCLAAAGIAAEPILKMHEGRPNIVDAITNGRSSWSINTPSGKESKQDDSYIRKTAVRRKVPYITTLAAALAAAKGIEACRKGRGRRQEPAGIPRRHPVRPARSRGAHTRGTTPWLSQSGSCRAWTCRTAASSRASISWTSATPATRWSARRPTARPAPTNWPCWTSRPRSRGGARCSTSCAVSPRSRPSRSRWAAGSPTWRPRRRC